MTIARAPAALVLVMFLLSAATSAQSARDAKDYARAEQWLRYKVGDLVRNLYIVPHWIGESDSFWYRNETGSGHEYVVVDATNGRKRPAFDHRVVAGFLQKQGVDETSADTLPFFSIEHDGRAIEFELTLDDTDQRFRCTVARTTCETVANPYRPPGLLVSPDERRAVLTRDGNLWLHDLESGSERPLTDDGEPNFGYGIYYGNWKASAIPRSRAGKPSPPMEAEWSPDSTRVLVTRIDQRHVEDYPWLETAPEDGSFRPKVHKARIPLTGEEPALVDYFVFNVLTGSKVRLDLPYETLFDVHQDMLPIREVFWDETRKHLYAITWGDDLEFAVLYDIDLLTGEAQEVVREAMSPRMDTNSTSYNPPNVRVIDKGSKVIWFSQRDGWGHLYLYDGKTGELVNQITRGDWLVRDLIHVDEERGRIFFTGAGREPGSPYDRYLYRVDYDGSDLVVLSPEADDAMLTSPWNDVLAIDGALGYQVVSPSGEYVAYNHSSVDEPTRFVVRRADDGELVEEIEKADASALYAAGWRDPEEFVVKAADGKTDLYGLMYKPRKTNGKRTVPIIDSQYASPLTAVVPRNFMMAIQGVPALVSPASLAELGFVSVVVDARGTTYRSREFSHYSWQNLNTIGLEDHVAAIKQLAKANPWMDISRVGIHGASYGGWAATRAMFEFPEFFKVGVANVPMGALHNIYPDYHWQAFHGEPSYEGGGELRPAKGVRPENYGNADGTVNAARLEGKMLIMMGELDENVLPSTTLQLVDALIELDQDFDMLYVPNRSHQLGSPHTMRRVWDYFVEHLGGVDPPRYRIAPF